MKVSRCLLYGGLWLQVAVLFAQTSRPFRLNEVKLENRIIWGAECLEPDGHGLAFGGQDQDSPEGRPRTRLLRDGTWVGISQQLKLGNPLQAMHERIWSARDQTRRLLSIVRHQFFQGVSEDDEDHFMTNEIRPLITRLLSVVDETAASLGKTHPRHYENEQIQFAGGQISRGRRLLLRDDWTLAALCQALHRLQIRLEIAAESLDAEPPARAMDCGTARLGEERGGPESRTLVHDPASGLYILFGGDHLDYLTNDTWVFDPTGPRWYQRHPRSAPPPRANHRLEVLADGKVRMSGGYTYASSIDYLGGQYLHLDDGEWTYDIKTDRWSGGRLTAPDSRTYRSGPFHPNEYFRDPRPDAAAFAKWLEAIPANEWVTTNPPHRPRLNRDWGTARIDPHRDMMLRWSGGHSAHGGTDVLHFHFATNRWELPFPVEFPLGQLYSNTSYPDGFNFNRRPWMTGHTYQNYDYDLPSRMMIKAGRPRYYYIYDPDFGDWIGRGLKPPGMQYNNCFYTLTLASTPRGIMCWDRNGRIHRYNHDQNEWTEIETSGHSLPGAYVDYSSMVYDSRRDRLLILNAPGYGQQFTGEVWSVDLKTRAVVKLLPEAIGLAARFANVDKSVYDPVNDLVLLGTYLTDAGDHTPTPAYDCASNRWVSIPIAYATTKRPGRITRAFPHARSDGLMFDPARRLIWGTDANSQVYVLRLFVKSRR